MKIKVVKVQAADLASAVVELGRRLVLLGCPSTSEDLAKFDVAVAPVEFGLEYRFRLRSGVTYTST